MPSIEAASPERVVSGWAPSEAAAEEEIDRILAETSE